MREVEDKAHLSHTAFIYRWRKYQKGLLKEEDLLKPAFCLNKSRKRRGHRITIKGVTYNSLKEIEDKHHIGHTAFMYRWEKYKAGEISEDDLIRPANGKRLTKKAEKC